MASGDGPETPFSTTHPSDLELLQGFLGLYVEKEQNWPYFHSVDVYTTGPAQLTNSHAAAVAADGTTAWYFFTKLREKAPCSKRRCRSVATGEGSWHSEAARIDVVNVMENRKVGVKQSFCFMLREKNEQHRPIRSGWLMTEYTLTGEEDGAAPVLCKLYRTPRKSAGWHAPSESALGRTDSNASSNASPRASSDASPRADQVLSALRVHPSDMELVNHYLKPRATSCLTIHDADVYSVAPKELTSGFSPSKALYGQEAWYFFSKRCLRNNVPVDSAVGVWSSEYGTKMICDGSHPIGKRQLYSFFKMSDQQRVSTRWRLVEITLLQGGAAICLHKIYKTEVLTGRKRKRTDSWGKGKGVKKVPANPNVHTHSPQAMDAPKEDSPEAMDVPPKEDSPQAMEVRPTVWGSLLRAARSVFGKQGGEAEAKTPL